MKWGGLYMAKLTGVKTIDMTGGEITAIEYGGAIYTEVATDREGIQIGDILCTTEKALDVTLGAFYEVVESISGRTTIRDDVNMSHTNVLHDNPLVFRKASESPQASAPFAEMVMARMSDVGAQVDAVERKVAAIEAKLAPEELTIGDRVLISGMSKYGANHNGEVGTFNRIKNHEGYSVVFDGGEQRFYNRNQLTKVIEEAPKPKTGVIVVITANTNGSHNKVGDIGMVEHAPLNGKYSASVRVPGTTSTKVYTKYSEMRLATPAEIAKYERARAAAAKDSVFTKAGRKPNEYRKGDVVRVTEEFGRSLPKGSLTVITEGGGNYVVSDGVYRYLTSDIEIVCFAENRADLAKGAC